jgi:hypothetical protein
MVRPSQSTYVCFKIFILILNLSQELKVVSRLILMSSVLEFNLILSSILHLIENVEKMK